jgi:hypothetical protein
VCRKMSDDDAGRLRDFEVRLDALEKRIEEIISQLAWLLEVTP